MNKHTIHYRNPRCPINCSLEMVGDSWSLLIVRDILYFGNKTYGGFISSPEKIARNILATRLVQLEQKGIIIKKPHPTDGRKDIYELTEKGLDLIPIILDFAEWGAKYEPSTTQFQTWLKNTTLDREALVKLVHETVRDGGSILIGENSVVSKLQSIK